MMRRLPWFVFSACLALAPVAALAESKIPLKSVPLKSVKVDLPDDRRMFPDGPGADAVNGNCLACHSAGMVLYQPLLTKAQWESEVGKMRYTYRAPIDP